jgi:hypothetical protein
MPRDCEFKDDEHLLKKDIEPKFQEIMSLLSGLCVHDAVNVLNRALLNVGKNSSVN